MTNVVVLDVYAASSDYSAAFYHGLVYFWAIETRSSWRLPKANATTLVALETNDESESSPSNGL